jgi:hypothetical protein
MKKIIFFSALVTLICSCDHNSGTSAITINLIKQDDPILLARSVILYDQVDYLIKTPLDTFLSGYPFNKNGFSDMKTKAINDSQTKNVLIATDYLKYDSDSIHTLVYYLENGSCLVLDKISNKIITTIRIETYLEGDPGISTGGRRFYINNKLQILFK